MSEGQKGGWLHSMRKKIGREGAIIAAATMLHGDISPRPRQYEPHHDTPAGDSELQFRAAIPESSFDDKPDYFVTHHGGEYTPEERGKHIEEVAPGIRIFHDIDLDFYHILHGENIGIIRQKLGRLPKYQHLADQKTKLQSFNIPAKDLQVGMWLPIPLETKDRLLTDEQFAQYCHQALGEMRHDEPYRENVERLLTKVSESDIIASMVAVAKQESGGLPLGQFEMHRWEPSHNRFSFSLFHVLMEGPGIKARKKLGFTEGQLYHPKNAAKLFLGFLVEKAYEQGLAVNKLLPLDGAHLQHFASFYNGTNWHKTNPHYMTNVGAYYAQARGMMDAIENGDQPPKSATTINVVPPDSLGGHHHKHKKAKLKPSKHKK